MNGRVVELDRSGQVALRAGEPQHGPEPARRGQRDETETRQHRARPTEPQPGHSEPQRTQEEQHRLADPARQPEQERGADERTHVPLSHSPGTQCEPGGERGLDRVGEADHSVRPEQRARGEPEGRQDRDPTAVELPSESIEQEHRERAGRDGERAERRGRIRERGREQPTEAHIQDVARRMGLVPDDVEPIEGERELDRVPGGQDARTVGPAAGKGQAPDGQREDPVRARHRAPRARCGSGPPGQGGDSADGSGVMRAGGGEEFQAEVRRPSSPRGPSRPSRSSRPRSALS